jgi:hypothetical protein
MYLWGGALMYRLLMVVVAFAWLLALPYEGLWKGAYIDEHAIQPAQVCTPTLFRAVGEHSMEPMLKEDLSKLP